MKHSAIFIHQVSGPASLPRYYDFVDSFCDFNGVENKDVYVISNGQKISDGERVRFYECGNELREFTAWKKGVEEVGEKIVEYDLLVMSNETIFHHRNFDSAYKAAFWKAASLIKGIEYPVAAGDLDQIVAKPPYYFSCSRNYLSTYLIVLNNSAINVLDKKFEFQDLMAVLRADKNAESVLRRENDIVTGEYLEMLEGWVYKNSRYKKWYGFEKLNNDNYLKMQSKLLSIIVEHSFSQGLAKRGCELVDVRAFIERDSMAKIYNLAYRLSKSAIIRIKWILRGCYALK